MKDIKVNLFALTGFGNVALKTLLELDVQVLKVYTRKELGEFPYYKEKKLDRLALKNNIPVVFIAKNGDWSIEEKADINLTTTFHRILHQRHLNKAKLNINIHPSLLPSYKGPTPTNWMIHQKEKICGITAHYITNNIDAGEIIYQKEYPLKSKTDAQLRKFLALKIKNVVKYIISNYQNYKVIKSNYHESYYDSYYKLITQ